MPGVSPGHRMWMPMPSSGDGAFGDSKLDHVPTPSPVAHPSSLALRIHQPSSAGWSPVSVSSIFASSMRRTLVHALRVGEQLRVLGELLLERALELGVDLAHAALGDAED